MRPIAIALALLVWACSQASDPRLNAGVVLTPDGVRIHPSAAVRVGDVGVVVSR